MRASNKNAPAEMSREGLSIFFDDFTLSHFQVCIKGNSEELTEINFQDKSKAMW